MPGNEEPAETFPQTLEQIEENVTNWDVVNEDNLEEVAEEDERQVVERGEEQMWTWTLYTDRAYYHISSCAIIVSKAVKNN